MLKFHRVAGIHIVQNEEQAYKYWLRMVKACVQAEKAYGPRVVHRIRYSDLIDKPEPVMRSLLDFLGEPYTAKCLVPLGQRINSSNVPADFKADDPATDPAVSEKAMRLCAKLAATPQPPQASCAAADELEAAFREQAQLIASLQSESRAHARAERLAKEVKRKRVIIQELRASRQGHKLMRLLFGRGAL